MNFLLIILLKLAKALIDEFPYTCSEYACKDYQISNTECDPLCMSPPCNYDSPEKYTQSWFLRFQLSGCYSLCKNSGCNLESLEKYCDPLCNIPDCGFGLGACGYCAAGCTKEMLLNNICDDACNSRACMYDNNACGWCAPNCFYKDLNLLTCKDECSGPECNYQNLVCSKAFCAPGCSPSMQNDEKCDVACNNQQCDYDNWRCTCSPGCTIYMQTRSKVCHNECNTPECNFQNTICGSCASGCKQFMIGNKNCDAVCNNAACNYDEGDCSCAYGCNSKYDPDTNSWEWDEGEDGCKVECLVQDCLFNYAVCKDFTKIRVAWFQQLAIGDSGRNFNLTACYNNHPGCTKEILWEIDRTGICNEVCNNSDCLGCMGLNNISSSCSRFFDGHCLICNNSKQVNDYCFTSPHCPSGFEVIKGLSDNVFHTDICFADPTKYSFKSPFTIYVNETGDDNNNGTIDFQIKSLSIALQLCTRRFNTIQIAAGSYEFSKSAIINPLVVDSSSPLRLTTHIIIDKIEINGDWSDTTFIYLIKDSMSFETKASGLYFSHLTFNGKYSLSSSCAKDSCMYCPNVLPLNEIMVDDREEIITDYKDYSKNCNDFIGKTFISTSADTELYLYEMSIENFQQQFKSFIYAEGSTSLKYVNFKNIQSYELGYFITVVCILDCNKKNFVYSDGVVENLNNGYEYRELLVQPGFLWIEGLNSTLISFIVFDYAMIVTGSQASNVNYLIHIKNVLGTIKVYYCAFTNSIVNGILNIDSQSLSYLNLTLESDLNVSQYSGWHLDISDNDFKNITSLVCLICYSMGTVVQSINIQSVSFENIASGNQGIINVLSYDKFDSLSQNGGWSFVKVDGKITRGFLGYRNISLAYTSFKNISSAGPIIRIENQPNIKIDEICIENVHDFNVANINEYSISQFINNPGHYLRKPLSSSEISSSQCRELIMISYSSYIAISNVNLKSIECSSENGAIFLSDAHTLEIDSVHNENIHGHFHSGVFYIYSIANIKVNNFTFTDVGQDIGSVLHIFSSSFISIDFFVGINLLTLYSPCVSIEKVSKLYLNNFLCEDCATSDANGGALYLIPDTLNSKIYIRNYECKKCYALSGVGAGIYLDSYSVFIRHDLVIQTARFTNCVALDGAAIYIAQNFGFNLGEISNLMIEESSGSAGGVFTDFHNSGMLNIWNITLSKNSGYYSGIKAAYSRSTVMLSVSQTYILYSNPIYSVFYFDKVIAGASIIFSSIKIESSTQKFIQAYDILLNASNIQIQSGEGIFLHNTSFYGNNINFSSLDGNAFNIVNSTLFCNNCRFINSTESCALVIKKKSCFYIANSIFNDNYSSKSAISLYISGSICSNTFKNCIFSANKSPNISLFETQASNLIIINSTIEKTVSSAVTPGISLLSSTLYLYNSTLRKQQGNLGGFVYLSTYSLVEAYNTSFSNGIADNGGAIFSIVSTFKATQCKFINNQNIKSLGSGGALYGTSDSNFTIDSCTFIDNSSPLGGSSIYFSGSTLNISNSTFYTSKAEDFFIRLSNVNSFFFNASKMSGELSSGIFSSQSKSLKLNYSVFENLNGALVVQSRSSINSNIYEITICEFLNNSVLAKGGALLLNEASVLIKNSLFVNNSAESGGAISYTCPDVSCTFSISDTIFSNNSALIKGGAIEWAGKKPKYFNVSFSNNSANYGSDAASIPAILDFASNSRFLNSIECVPGQLCTHEINLEIKDSSGNIMLLDNSSMATMTILNKSYSISGSSQQTSNMGTFTFKSYVILGTPGTEVNLTISTNAIDRSQATKVEDIIDYVDSVSILIRLRDCTTGEQITKTACFVCEKSSYLIKPAKSCNSCPIGGNCTGGFKIYPLPGYWKPSNLSEVIYSCPNSQACLGAVNESDFMGSCLNGYTGNKCFGCIVGYSRTGVNDCEICPNNNRNTMIFIALIILFIFQGTVMTFTTIKTAYSKKSLYSIYIKIFTNYLQLLFIINKVDLKWPWYVSKLFSAQNYIATISDQVFSLDCYLRENSDDYASILFKKIIFMALLPPIVWGVSLLVWVTISLKAKNWSYLKKEYFTTMIVLFFLIYPIIVRSMFSVFSCVYISESGYWMSENLQVKCWDSNQHRNLISIGAPSIIIWAIGVPSIVLIQLHKNRKKLNQFAIRVIFGFFFQGYKQSKYYWEFIILYRKIVIICIIVFMTQFSKATNGLILVFVLLIALAIQDRFKPYNLPHLNHMEIEGILTATVTIYCGLYYAADDAGSQIHILLFVIIVTANIYFIIYWIYYMIKAIIEMMSMNFWILRKIFGKSETYQNYTFDEKIILKRIKKNTNEESYSYTLFEKRALKSTLIYMKGARNAEEMKEKNIRKYFNRLRRKSNFSTVLPEEKIEQAFGVRCQSFENDFEEVGDFFIQSDINKCENTEI